MTQRVLKSSQVHLNGILLTIVITYMYMNPAIEHIDEF